MSGKQKGKGGKQDKGKSQPKETTKTTSKPEPKEEKKTKETTTEEKKKDTTPKKGKEGKEGGKKGKGGKKGGADDETKTDTPSTSSAADKADETKAPKPKLMDNESESDKEVELPNRAPKLDPYGPAFTREQERERVEVKPSRIPGAGNGVFALFDFAKGDVVSEFLGKKCATRDEAYNGMMYAVEFTGDSGELILLDGWGYDNAAALANDALGRTRVPFLRNNARFTHYGDRMFLCAKRTIRKGDEIYVQYGHEYWQMEEDEYFEVNTGSDIIEKKLDTCH